MGKHCSLFSPQWKGSKGVHIEVNGHGHSVGIRTTLERWPDLEGHELHESTNNIHSSVIVEYPDWVRCEWQQQKVDQ